MKVSGAVITVSCVVLCLGLLLFESKNLPVQIPAEITSGSYPELIPDPELAGLKIDINMASAAEIEQLPGIGPAKAQDIYQFVRKNGPLTSIDQLLEVDGIGEKTLARIRPYLYL